MKKRLFLLTCFCIMLTFTACGESVGTAPDESTDVEAEETIYFDGTLLGFYEYSSGGDICVELSFDEDDQKVIMKPLNSNFSETEGTFSTDGKTMNINGLESTIEYIEPSEDVVKEWIKGYNVDASDSSFPEIDKAEVSGANMVKFMIYDELPTGAQVTFFGVPKDSVSIVEKTTDYSDSPVIGEWKCTKATVGGVECSIEDLNADHWYMTFNADGTADYVLNEGHEGTGKWKPGNLNEIEFHMVGSEWTYEKQTDSIMDIEDTDDGKLIYYFTRI